ncbi:encapsulin-associated ferritin-like protein [Polyangium aurulentum]|uniref:encapsulin-associated ferritin-like protein n=1 Tax=Polyangium aurulentum TaxID=2567896 RepID=UPI0010AE4576|nr:ferritin-like domain-containing protein [Polyangium aurulentum]UQA61112.1 ferritin-like domain-containing protein [Polyangium aurulentum]
MGSESWHEPYESLPAKTRDLHRAIVSLMEELEAIDWYGQRAAVCEDDSLRAVLLHNREEEIEHAMMNLEWIRRNEPLFDKYIRTYLLKSEPITEIEEQETNGNGGAQGGNGSSGTRPMGGGSNRGLGIGSLRGK